MDREGDEREKGIRIFISMCSYLYFGVFYMSSKNITLKVSTELYEKYRDLCKKEGWIVSRQFEKLMERELKKRGREKQ